MGLLKKQLLDVIEWKDNSKDTIVYRYKLEKREEIMNSSTLVVRPSQIAMLVHKGQIADVFEPGTYKLSTENIPFITKMLSLPTGFNSPIKAEVYFLNTKQMTGQKWGTQNPIMMRDKEFGNVRLRAFGVFSYKVNDAKVFMEEMFGTNEVYTTSDVSEQIKPMVVQGFSDAVAESKISALDLSANYNELSKSLVDLAQDNFAKYGLKLCSLVIENISLPEEVEKALDERTKLGVIEDKLGTYTKYQAAQAMRDAANNPNGGVAGMGVGMGAGLQMGELLASSLKDVKDTKKSEDTKVCPKCNAVIKASAKFCNECGAKQEVSKVKHCTECGAEIKANAKFCSECGAKQ